MGKKNNVDPDKKYNESHYMSRTTLINFYEELLSKGKIQLNGAGHQRLKDLRKKRDNFKATRVEVHRYQHMMNMRVKAEARRLRDLE